jgi:hypothetical protein
MVGYVPNVDPCLCLSSGPKGSSLRLIVALFLPCQQTLTAGQLSGVACKGYTVPCNNAVMEGDGVTMRMEDQTPTQVITIESTTRAKIIVHLTTRHSRMPRHDMCRGQHEISHLSYPSNQTTSSTHSHRQNTRRD